MVDVSAAQVKALREKSGAGMLDCKKALEESNGDLEGAVDWLRKKGLAAVAKKSSRSTTSGLVGVAQSSDKKTASVVEINAETDFVARNELFSSMTAQVCKIALTKEYDVESLKSAPFEGESATVGEEITRLVATIGENMNLRRVSRLTVDKGEVSTYMHLATKPGLGKIGVAVALDCDTDKAEALSEVGKKLCLHIAASSPEALNVEDVKPENLQRSVAMYVLMRNKT
jgi:elongation factor Ts